MTTIKCNVGDTIYFVDYDFKKIITGKVETIKITKSDRYVTIVDAFKLRKIGGPIEVSRFQLELDEIFLTIDEAVTYAKTKIQEEAEEKIKSINESAEYIPLAIIRGCDMTKEQTARLEYLIKPEE